MASYSRGIRTEPSAATHAENQRNMERAVFNSEGLDIYGVLREADGPKTTAIVFCHGAFEFQDNWFAYAERLNSEGFTTFTFDFAGHGDSEGLRGLVNLRVWAYNIRDALNYLQTRGYRRFALVGWGSGGSAALLAAAHDPRLSCAVILSAPVYLLPPLPERIAYGLVALAAKIKKAIFKRPLTLSRLNELAEMRMLSDGGANERYLSNPKVREIYQAVPIPDSLDSVWIDITLAAKKVNIPVLVMHGSEDKIIPVDQSQKLYDLLSGEKELKLLQGCGHAVHLDREKDAVYGMISGWVRDHL